MVQEQILIKVIWINVARPVTSTRGMLSIFNESYTDITQPKPFCKHMPLWRVAHSSSIQRAFLVNSSKLRIYLSNTYFLKNVPCSWMMDDFFSVSMLRFMCVRRLFFLFGIRLCNLLDEYALKNVKRIQFDGSVFMILYVDKCKSIYSSSFKHERMQRAIKFACVCLCKNEREREKESVFFVYSACKFRVNTFWFPVTRSKHAISDMSPMYSKYSHYVLCAFVYTWPYFLLLEKLNFFLSFRFIITFGNHVLFFCSFVLTF